MNTLEAAEKIKKLLNAVKHGSHSPGELASMASLAQSLIHKYNIDSILLSTKTIEANDEIVQETVFSFKGPRVLTFMLNLGSALAETNTVKLWYRIGNGKNSGSLEACGRSLDLAAVRYLCNYLFNEVEILTKQASIQEKERSEFGACSKTWTNSFKLGCVSEISKRIREEAKRQKAELLNPNLAYEKAIREQDNQKILELDNSPKYAIATIQNAISKIEGRRKLADEWAEAKFGKFVAGPKRVHAKRYDAYSQGVEKGKTVNISNKNKGLT